MKTDARPHQRVWSQNYKKQGKEKKYSQNIYSKWLLILIAHFSEKIYMPNKMHY